MEISSPELPGIRLLPGALYTVFTKTDLRGFKPMRRLTASLTAAFVLFVASAIAAQQNDSPTANPAHQSEPVTIKPAQVGDTPNVSSDTSGKHFFAGQPSESDLAEFAKRGVKTIVNLRTEPEMAQLGFDEKAAVESAGMKYVNLPMGRDLPSNEDLAKMFDALDAAQGAPVLLHCASSNRVGAVWALYRIDRAGLTADQAEAEGRAAGMKSDAFVEVVRARAQK